MELKILRLLDLEHIRKIKKEKYNGLLIELKLLIIKLQKKLVVLKLRKTKKALLLLNLKLFVREVV
jgi:hypothetical protein